MSASASGSRAAESIDVCGEMECGMGFLAEVYDSYMFGSLGILIILRGPSSTPEFREGNWIALLCD